MSKCIVVSSNKALMADESYEKYYERGSRLLARKGHRRDFYGIFLGLYTPLLDCPDTRKKSLNEYYPY